MAGNAIDPLGWRFYDFWHGEACQMDVDGVGDGDAGIARWGSRTVRGEWGQLCKL